MMKPSRHNPSVKMFILGLLLCISTYGYAKQERINVEPFFGKISTPLIHPLSSPKRVLFVGNSFSFYNNGIHNHLAGLVRSSGEWKRGQNRIRLSTLSGGYISEQMVNLKNLLGIATENWQAVVLQGHSSEPVNPRKKTAFIKGMTLAVKQIKAKGIQPILFMTWGYKGKRQMGRDIAEAYISLANKLDTLVVPVGLAFAVAETELSQIELFVPDVLGVDSDQNLTYRKDWKHPSEAGTYLAACVFYSVLYQRSPEGLAFTGKLDKTTALALQKLSWRVSNQFYLKG